MKNKDVSISFDINDVKKSAFCEHYSKYTSDKGNNVELYELIVDSAIYLLHGTIIPNQTSCIEIEARNDYVYFVFVLDNTRVYTIIDNQDEKVSIPVSSLQQMAFVMKKGDFLRVNIDPKKLSTVFEMSFSVDYLLKMLPKRHFLYAKLKSSKVDEVSSSLFDFPMILDTKMKSLLYDMIYCRYTDIAKALFIKAKLLEFFALQQLQSENKNVVSKIINISDVEKNRMFLARDVLLKNIRFPPTIVELARHLGTNECYLKQNFKLVFGSTIYGYVKQVRMERARKLLMQKKNINEVARIIGYKHSSHFSSAFKKHFGYVPNKVS